MKSSVVLALCLIACRGENPGVDVDANAPDAPEGPDGTGCTARTPRTQAPEVFVGPTGLETRMASLIDGAKTSLDIQMYLFTSSSLANKIVAAKNRGVLVRVLLDPDHEGNTSVESTLTSGGVTWKPAPSLFSFSHAKYLIVDRAQAVIMSMNWNYDAFIDERNYGMVDRDPEDIADVQRIFDADWAMANGGPAQVADLACTRLIVSPTNAKSRLVELINSAQSTLDLELMYMSEDSIRNAVAMAKGRGVTVRALMQESMGEDITYLKGLGVTVRSANSFFLHAKLIIADDVAFVGSENMSFTSLTKNREVGALAFEPTSFAPIRTQFDSDWAGATPVP
jgi:phosphatidylserine/phosphatidylglycerophosphate/cardiolipin synthase-like enzyme